MAASEGGSTSASQGLRDTSEMAEYFPPTAVGFDSLVRLDANESNLRLKEEPSEENDIEMSVPDQNEEKVNISLDGEIARRWRHLQRLAGYEHAEMEFLLWLLNVAEQMISQRFPASQTGSQYARKGWYVHPVGNPIEITPETTEQVQEDIPSKISIAAWGKNMSTLDNKGVKVEPTSEIIGEDKLEMIPYEDGRISDGVVTHGVQSCSLFQDQKYDDNKSGLYSQALPDKSYHEVFTNEDIEQTQPHVHCDMTSICKTEIEDDTSDTDRDGGWGMEEVEEEDFNHPEHDEYFDNLNSDSMENCTKPWNANTEKKTIACAANFKEFVLHQGFPKEKDILEFEYEELDVLIGNWLLNAKKKDGTEYEPDSLCSLHRGLERYLRVHNYGKNILTDVEFETSRKVLSSKRKQLKAKGLGTKKYKSEALTFEDEEEMWAKGGLGTKDPDVLQETVWYLISKLLSLKGRNKYRQLSYGDLVEKKDKNGNCYFLWTEKISKTREQNCTRWPFNPKIFPIGPDSVQERCPVKIIKEFLSRRPHNMCHRASPFFLQVNRSRKESATLWYKSQALGKNSLVKFMRNIAARAGILGDRRITNHSVSRMYVSPEDVRDTQHLMLGNLTSVWKSDSEDDTNDTDGGSGRRMEEVEEADFSLLPENEKYTISDLKNNGMKAMNVNTERKTNASVAHFKEFVQNQGFPKDKDILDLKYEELDVLIGNWLLNAKKKDGSEYEPDSLCSLHRGLDRYLRHQNYGKNILTAVEFETSRKVMSSKQQELKAKGLGNKKYSSEALTYEDEEEMWATGSLGTKDPDVLQETVWYLMSKLLGIKGRHEYRQLSYGDLEEKRDEKGNTYFEWTEKISKKKEGNSSCRPFNPKIFPVGPGSMQERCPVKIIKDFLSRRPRNMRHPESPFFLQVHRSCKETDPMWYKSQALGKNSLSKFMRNIAARAGILGERRITNHSVRKTCVSRLLDAGVPPTAVAQLSGYKNVNSLHNYYVLNITQQKAMSNILSSESSDTGQSERQVAPSTSSASMSETLMENTVSYNTHNTHSAPIQINTGEKRNFSTDEYVSRNTHNIVHEPDVKRRRILTLCCDSDSES